MARHPFGTTQVVIDLVGNRLLGVPGTFWSAQSGGTQYTDLRDGSGNATSSITTDAYGRFTMQGPDSVFEMWADFGTGAGARFRVVCDDAGTLIQGQQTLITDLQTRVAALETGTPAQIRFTRDPVAQQADHTLILIPTTP